MNIHLLDIPTGWQEMRETRRQREEQYIKEQEATLKELRQALNAKRQAVAQLENDVYSREEMLKEFAPKEYKKYQKKLEEMGLASNTTSDDNTINLASSAAAGTTASVAVNDSELPSTETTTSSVGSFVMICTALFLCGTSALFYGKKNRL